MKRYIIIFADYIFIYERFNGTGNMGLFSQ